MRNILVSVLALLFFVSIVSAQEKAVKAGEKAPLVKDKVKTEKVQGSESATAVANTVCPVSGEELEDYDHTIKYEGKTYAVCCKKCLAKIEKDPEKYISRLSEDGKSLKKK